MKAVFPLKCEFKKEGKIWAHFSPDINRYLNFSESNFYLVHLTYIKQNKNFYNNI